MTEAMQLFAHSVAEIAFALMMVVLSFVMIALVVCVPVWFAWKLFVQPAVVYLNVRRGR